jgi:hypothetical protein
MIAAPPSSTTADTLAASGAAILDELDRLFFRFVAFPSDEARWATALWTVHTHCLQAFESTPRIAFLSPEKGSGKTRALEVLGMVATDPIHAVNISAAALYRVIGNGDRTLLLDEADTYLGAMVAKQHEDLRGLINAGHRRGAEVYRAEVSGKAVKVVAFPAFAPAALAGLGELPDTIIDRSIVIQMRRRAPDETVEPFRERYVRAETDELRDRIAIWTTAMLDTLTESRPEMPYGITDRPADVWEPLIVIGDECGEVWADRARQAATVLNAIRQERDPSLGVLLLSDCRRLFTDRGVDRLTSEQLVESLNNLVESPWGDLRGKPIDTRGVAKRLRKYSVRPGDHRFGETTKKGYRIEDFHDAWTRYLPPVADVALVAHPQGCRGDDPLVAPTEDDHTYVLFSKGEGDRLSSPADGQQGQQGQHPSPKASEPGARFDPLGIEDDGWPEGVERW